MNKALAVALQAIEDKKAHDVMVLDISEVSSFTDYFVLCTGTSSRQVQAIADAVEEMTTATGNKRAHIEGYANAEWILIDFLDFVIHVFSPTARAFYSLERLWRDGKRIEPESIIQGSHPARSKARTKSTSAKPSISRKTASKKTKV
jgi:ribosome-associated protein